MRRPSLHAIRRIPRPLALLLVVAALLSGAWSLSTAQMQGPDEMDHIAYVAHLAETGKIPSATTGNAPYAPDQGQALFSDGWLRLLENRAVRPPWSALSERDYRKYEDALPSGAPGRGAGPNSVGKNPPLYYVYEAIGWKLTPGGHFFGRIFVLRLFSGLLLLALVTFTWLLAGEVFRRRLPQTVAAGVVALLPMDGFMSGIVNPDIMLAAIYSLFLWTAVRTCRLGLTWQRAVGLSVITVAAVLTQGRGLALVPVLPVALIVAWLRHRQGLRDTVVSAASATATVVAGFVVYRLASAAAGGGAALYGGEVNLGNSSVFNVRQMLSGIWQFYLPKLDQMAPRIGPAIGYRQLFVQQYVAGVFSSFDVYFPYWVYDLVQVFAGIGLIALYSVLLLRRRAVIARWAPAIILATTALVLLLFLHVASYRALVNGSNNPLIVGRYLLPLGPILGVAAGAILAGLPRRAAAAVGGLLLAGLLMLSLGGLGLSLERFYA
ncbi:MAG TPA: hypothetical protein VGM33_06935 [Baekduia sp.]